MKQRIVWLLMIFLAVLIGPTTGQARYLNSNTGRFQTMDSYEGSNQNPASLHKYLYCHSDPVDATDPSGMVTATEVLAVTFLTTVIAVELNYTASSVYRQTRGQIKKVNIYLTPYNGTDPEKAELWRSRLKAKAFAIETHIGAIVPTRIHDSALPGGVKSGFDSKTKTYNVDVVFRDRGTLGYAPNSTVYLNHAKLWDQFDKIDRSEISEDQLQFVSANVLVHETVHAIENRAGWRSFPQHESNGLMTGPPYSTIGFNFNEAKNGMIPFSEKTEQRLKTAVGTRR